MLYFLRDVNISDKTIKCMYDNLSNDIIMALNDNRDECIKTINLFRKIGINYIDELLIDETYVFLKSFDRLNNKLKNYNIFTFVEQINNDYTYIEKLI